MNLFRKLADKLDYRASKARLLKEMAKFIKAPNERFVINEKLIRPSILDNTKTTEFDAHYIYHPAWALRILKETQPAKHVDISSTLTFCSMASAYHTIEFYDYRPAELTLSNLSSGFADLNALPFASGSLHSLSCMHTVEHIGLGRYGDALDYDGDLKAIHELKRVLGNGGNLLFVVPVCGEAKIIFNSHRIYTYSQVRDLFCDLELINFALVTDDNKFYANSDEILSDQQEYGCGCFWFRKK